LPNRWDGGHERRGRHQTHSGNSHQPLDLRRVDRPLGDLTLQDRDLAADEIDVAQAPIDRVAFITWELKRSEPLPAALAEHVAHRRAPLQVAHQHRMDLVLGTGALPNQLRAAAEPPAQRASAVIRQPASTQQAGGQQPRELLRVQPVGLRLRGRDRRELFGRSDDHPSHMRLQQPGDLQRIPSRLQRHMIVSSEGPDQDPDPAGLLCTRPAERTPAVLADRDLAEIEMHIQTDKPQTALPSLDTTVMWETGGRTTRTDSCSRHNRASRRGGHRGFVGLTAHLKHGLPSLRSPKSPIARCTGR
jgi:hypothetical protein